MNEENWPLLEVAENQLLITAEARGFSQKSLPKQKGKATVVLCSSLEGKMEEKEKPSVVKGVAVCHVLEAAWRILFPGPWQPIIVCQVALCL